jgi:hypothetical protein
MDRDALLGAGPNRKPTPEPGLGELERPLERRDLLGLLQRRQPIAFDRRPQLRDDRFGLGDRFGRGLEGRCRLLRAGDRLLELTDGPKIAERCDQLHLGLGGGDRLGLLLEARPGSLRLGLGLAQRLPRRHDRLRALELGLRRER